MEGVNDKHPESSVFAQKVMAAFTHYTDTTVEHSHLYCTIDKSATNNTNCLSTSSRTM